MPYRLPWKERSEEWKAKYRANRKPLTPEQRVHKKRYDKDRYPSIRDQRQAQNKAYMANPDNALKIKRYKHGWKIENKYILTIQEYEELEKAQNFACAICKRPDKRRKLAVDHNHATHKVRGLLCNACNRGLGYLQDSVQTLLNAIEYLRADNV